MNINTALVTDTSRAVTEASVDGYRDQISAHTDADWEAHLALKVDQTPYLEITTPVQYVVASAQLRWLLTYRDGAVNKTEAFITPAIFSGTTVAPPLSLPRFLRSPADLTVPVGAPAHFSAYVASSTPVSYQWQNRTAGVIDITGANSSTYDILTTVITDQGTYALAATNTVGTTLSGLARLSINP